MVGDGLGGGKGAKVVDERVWWHSGASMNDGEGRSMGISALVVYRLYELESRKYLNGGTPRQIMPDCRALSV